jgi:endonuclease/exonuclease/phosphatase family metal-dependent hydrolase
MAQWSKVQLVLFLVWGTPVVFAGPFDEKLPQISWTDAAQHYGERCIVYGAVVNARDIGKRCFLNFSPDIATGFTVVIEQKDYGKFTEAPEKAYIYKPVRVVGKVVEYKSKPEIVIDGPDQIEVVASPDPPAPTAPTAPAAPPPAAKAPAPPPVAPPPAAKAPATAPAAVPTTAPTTAPAGQEKPPPVYKKPVDGMVTVGTFNVMNLFDDYDDPYLEQEQLPGKPAEEVRHLAETIHKLDADVLALEEVENRGVLEQFVHTHLADMGYQEIELIEGNYVRGVDVALLSRFPLGPVTSYRHLDFTDASGRPQRFQRDLLQVRVRPPGLAEFDVFVVHLKSKLGGEAETLPVRLAETSAIRGVFDNLLRQRPEAYFLLCGDFNDTIDSPALQRLIGAGPGALRTLYADIPPEQQITFNHTHLSMIDFILASPALAKTYVKDSYKILSGTIESNGSDHNPVRCRFQLPAASETN